MQLKILQATSDSVQAGYSCPCGCQAAVEYRRDATAVHEGCCCGNEFAVGPEAGLALEPRPGFHAEQQSFDTPWGERLGAAWLIGPSVHAEEHAQHESPPAGALDPVCGMTVEPEAARARSLHSSFAGTDYFFCGKGCKLEFEDDPERYLDPAYIPTM